MQIIIMCLVFIKGCEYFIIQLCMILILFYYLWASHESLMAHMFFVTLYTHYFTCNIRGIILRGVHVQFDTVMKISYVHFSTKSCDYKLKFILEDGTENISKSVKIILAQKGGKKWMAFL